jgi:hypothetical protein
VVQYRRFEELILMPITTDEVIPEAPTDTLAPEPPVRETADAQPLPAELKRKMDELERQDVSPAGRAA